MVVAFLLLPLTAVLIAPVWIYERSRNAWFWWDFGTPFVGFLLWVVLIVSGVGSSSLSDIIEMPLVLLAAVALNYLRLAMAVWVPSKVSPRTRSVLNAAVLFVFVVTLRLFMPPLAE